MATLSKTATLHLARGGSSEVRRVPQLFCVLECGSPLRPVSRHALDDVDEVRFVRANRHHERRPCSHGRQLLLGIHDRWLSAEHACISRIGDDYIFRDLNSKNGSQINGIAVDSATLRDCDVIEIGQTLLMFRASMPLPASEPRDFVISAQQTVLGMSTLHADLSARFSDLAQIARTDMSVAILGETGTGKDLVARAVHKMSQRQGKFVAVNCGALPKELAPSELFGHVKGAFSGAVADKVGLITSADKGTLFLDEIGDLPLDQQVVLLRVLQDRAVTAVGAVTPRKVDFRLVVATHRDIPGALASGHFRQDLWARVSGFVLDLPPLRGRREDLGLILGALLEAQVSDASKISIRSDAAYALLHYRWPQNVRELEQCLRASLALSKQRVVSFADLPEWLRTAHASQPLVCDAVDRGPDGPDAPDAPDAPDVDPADTADAPDVDPADTADVPVDATRGDPVDASDRERVDALYEDPAGALDEQRRALVIKLLEENDGNLSKVARLMKKGRTQIQRWLKRYGIDATRYRKNKR